MAKFRVMIVKKNGKPVGVRAAAINGRVIIIALQDEPQRMSWYDAVKIGIRNIYTSFLLPVNKSF